MTEPANNELLAVTLARIETKLDNAIALGSDHERRIRLLEEHKSSSDDHEPRLKILEQRQWPLPSLAVVLSVVAVIIPLVTR